LSGSGTATDPYVINDATDWATFATAVNNGTTYDGQYVKLSDSFDNSSSAVTDIVGVNGENNANKSFKGTFNGNNKTLHVNITDTEAQGAAPFRNISGATIKNLTVTGSVTGTTHAAGLVGFAREGTNTIENCVVNVNVSVPATSGYRHMGGVLGHGVKATVVIRNTVFSGTMSNSDNYAGGFQGWCDGNTLTIENCLFKGSYTGTASNGFHPIAIRNQNSTMSYTNNGAYYTASPTLTNSAYIAGAGTMVYASAPANEIYKYQKLIDGNNYYVPCTITGINESYQYTGSTITVTPIADGTPLTEGTDYTATYTKDGSAVSEVKELGTYTMTITAKSGSGYAGEKSFTFEVRNELTVYEGTAKNSYVPAYIYYFDDFTRSQFVIPAADLAVMDDGTINSISFYTTSDYIPYTTVSEVDVYLKEVAHTIISDFETKESSTIVYQGTLSIVSANGGVRLTINLSTPYIYGGGNLLIGIENTTDAGYNSISFYGQTVNGASVSGYNSSSLADVTATQRNFLPKTTFLYDVPSIKKPKDVTVSNVTNNSAEINWTDAEEGAAAWQIVYDTSADFNPDDATPIDVTVKPYTLTNLTPDTQYYVYVRVKKDSDFSNWSAKCTFTTPELCAKPTALAASNLTQNSATISWNGNANSYNVKYREATVTGTAQEAVFFDSFENGIDNWTIYIEDYKSPDDKTLFNTTDWHLISNNDADDVDAHTGEYMAMTRSYNGVDVSVDNWLVSPQMTLGDVLKFWVIDDGRWHEHLEVWVSTGTNAISDFVKLPNIGDATGEWTMKTVDLSAYAGQTGYIAIRHNDTGKDWIFIDDFGVYNTVNTYSYGAEHTLTTSDNSCNLTGLAAETMYEVQVQADYGNDVTSGWSTIYFTTPDACTAPTNLVASDITTNSVTLGWTDTQDSYNLRFRKVYFYEDFEGETLPTGWTTIDDNEDGNTWSIGHATTHSGDNGAYNLSYVYGSDGTTPDDYLVSPLLDLQGTLRVWLSGYAFDGTRYEENFEILLSTTGTSASDFTTTLVGETTTTNGYVEFTADLSSYAGQKGYIAVHHFNCTDQYYLYVDDFGLYGSENWVTEENVDDATFTLTDLQSNTSYEWQVQGLNCNGVGSETEWSEVAKFTTEAVSLILANNATDNSDAISGGDKKTFDIVTLSDRTLWQDGYWNTLCLPFSLNADEIAASPLSGADIRTLDNAKFNDGTLTLNFTPAASDGTVNGIAPVTSIEAGKPYIIKWSDGTNITDPVFTGVTIDATTHNVECDLGNGKSITFFGTYDYMSFANEDRSILFLGDNNTLYWPQPEGSNIPSIGACRAYFKLNGLSASEVSTTRLFFGEVEETTSLPQPLQREGSQAGAWYTLDGRKLDGKPAKKGVYINNGVKVVFK